MAIYDVENLLDDLKAILVAKLNPKIVAIAAEKLAIGQALDLPQIDTTEGIFFQTWDEKILNSSPGIIYGLRESAADGSSYQVTAQRVTLFVEIYYTNPMNEIDDGSGTKRILRYMRAVREVMQENFDANEILSKIKVKTITPLSFRLEGSSDEIKVGGVELETSIA